MKYYLRNTEGAVIWIIDSILNIFYLKTNHLFTLIEINYNCLTFFNVNCFILAKEIKNRQPPVKVFKTSIYVNNFKLICIYCRTDTLFLFFNDWAKWDCLTLCYSTGLARLLRRFYWFFTTVFLDIMANIVRVRFCQFRSHIMEAFYITSLRLETLANFLCDLTCLI